MSHRPSRVRVSVRVCVGQTPSPFQLAASAASPGSVSRANLRFCDRE